MLFKSRVLQIFVFFFIIVLFDQSFGYILHSLYFRQKASQNQILTYTFSQCQADIIVFGNSRAQHHYNSKILSDSLKMSCYNAGQDGGHSIIMQYAQIKVITKRYSPKIILLDFHPNNIVHYPGDYDRLSILLPFYKDYPEIQPMILLRNPYEKVKLLSSVYPFNSNIINIIRFNTNSHAARKRDFNGYVPLTGMMNINLLKPVIETEMQSVSVVDSNMVNALKNIIHLCKEKKIALYIISSPIFHQANEKKNLQTPAAGISLDIIGKEKIPYIDLSFNPMFMGKSQWFVDKVHLNRTGAVVFSKLLPGLMKGKGEKFGKKKNTY